MIRVPLLPLVVFCVLLVAVSAVITAVLYERAEYQNGAKGPAPREAAVADNSQPWGEVVALDIRVEQPEEYVSFDSALHRPALWAFPGQTPEQATALMAKCGLSEAQIAGATASNRLEATEQGTTVRPGAALVLALKPDVRGRFYTELARWPENTLMRQPYCLPATGARSLLEKHGVEPAAAELVEQLTYRRAGRLFFSDLEIVLQAMSSDDQRVSALQALSYQTAVLAYVKVSASTDVDKVLGYWCTAPGVRAKDLRPLLESVKETPEGGLISLLYLLPPFARERLYKFPQPTEAGDPRMDCHWTALNFFNETPDNRLQDADYASAYVREKFYPIGKPGMCGDIVFLLDDKGGVLHSAVYIADDIVFTKNGVNFGQPWILMRLRNLLSVYAFAEEPKTVYYRRKDI